MPFIFIEYELDLALQGVDALTWWLNAESLVMAFTELVWPPHTSLFYNHNDVFEILSVEELVMNTLRDAGYSQ